MDRQAFKQRMQNLKSYRENNPGKGYWDWKVEAFAEGGQTGDPEKERFYQATGRNCTDTIFNYYDSSYTGLDQSCYSTFDPRTDPLYSKDLTREELDALTNQQYFSEEELKYYFDLLVSRYCLYDKEPDTEENEPEEDIDDAIDELKREINELKEIQ